MQVEATNASRERALAELAKESELVFVGTVKSLGEPGAYWSGKVPSFQSVTYEVADVLKGSGENELTVHHVLVKNSPTAAPGDKPSLSTKLFAPGKKLIVFAQRTDDKTLRCYDERWGALAYQDSARQEISVLVTK